MVWFTVRDIMKKTDVSDPTIRRYIRDHGDFLKTSQEGLVLVVSEDSLPVIEAIRRGYVENGWRKQRVHDYLKENFPLSIVISKDEHGQEVTIGKSLEDLRTLKSIMFKLSEENYVLKCELNDIKQLLYDCKHNNEFILSRMNDLCADNRQKKGFFRRLLK